MTLDPARWGPPIAIAHRGSRYLWPENTMEAFSAAVGMGFAHIETDLHITSDGALVCFHDDSVDRTTQATGPVDAFTLEELQALDAGHRHGMGDGFPFRGQGLRAPTLEELLTTFPDVSVIVDLKTDDMEEPLVALIDRLDAHDRLIVGSFSEERLDRFRRASVGRIPTSTGPIAVRLWVIASRMGRGVPGSASALQVPTQMRGVRVVDSKLVDTAHGAGLHVHVWTVNEQSEMERLLDLGVDGLVTDRPDILKEVLAARGQWNGS